MSRKVTFNAGTVHELLGQLVGACSSTRFWDEMPENYPHGAGVFRGNVAVTLVDAAMDAYRNLPSTPEAHGMDSEEGVHLD